jgi:hypothetical protein
MTLEGKPFSEAVVRGATRVQPKNKQSLVPIPKLNTGSPGPRAREPISAVIAVVLMRKERIITQKANGYHGKTKDKQDGKKNGVIVPPLLNVAL